ncbi:MAG: DUF2799 domain-containing protein [Bdellovibrio sp.]|jgi:hypothetical protein
MKFFFLSFVLLATTSCTSYFKRKDCEKTNWFEYGQSVAERGQWLEADTYLNECRKVEADISASQLDLGFKAGREKYCSKENAFSMGRKGRLFAKDLCEGPELKLLLSQHLLATLEYCKQDNAHEAGLSGLPYLGVCPDHLEKKFMPPFRKGRLKFLEVSITEKERRVQSHATRARTLDSDRWSLNLQRDQLEREKNRLDSYKSLQLANGTPHGQQQASLYDGQISNVDSQLSSINNRLNDLDAQINNERHEAAKLEKEISDMRIEAGTL